jgi:phosphotransferase system  glucose/maltose/N-acetylglucosamine-specific IIC component
MSVSELSRSRPTTEPSHRLGLLAAIGSVFTKLRSWLGKLVSFVFTRAVLIFAIGFAVGMAWQAYGSDMRKAVAGWSPRLAWVAPTAATAENSRERLKATSLALAAVRQSVDKLATEVGRLQDQGGDDQRSGSRRGNQRR